MIKTILFLLTFSVPLLNTHSQTVTDIEGNTYNTITIGTQLWMQENLETTHFNNGDLIPTTTASVNNDPASVYQWSYNNDEQTVETYGRLYSWYAVVNENSICPTGWHVPSDVDWLVLSDFLGGDSIAGAKMKEVGTTHWTVTNSSIDNSSNFTGLPAGFRGNPSGFVNQGTLGAFWSSTPWGSDSFQRAYTYNLKTELYAFNALEQSVAVANCGLSVRCVSDLAVGLENNLQENGLTVFPNPTTDKITVSLKETGKYNLSVYAVSGSLVFQFEMNGKHASIDLSSFPNGEYLLKVNGEGVNAEYKLIRE